jgi:hypothetical protein
MLAGLSAGAALAGEITGPPGTPGVPRTEAQLNHTAAPDNANSVCAFSGLNDLVVGQGPIDFIVQSPGQNVRNGGPPGAPGHGFGPFPNGCRGGSNPDNP